MVILSWWKGRRSHKQWNIHREQTVIASKGKNNAKDRKEGRKEEKKRKKEKKKERKKERKIKKKKKEALWLPSYLPPPLGEEAPVCHSQSSSVWTIHGLRVWVELTAWALLFFMKPRHGEHGPITLQWAAQQVCVSPGNTHKESSLAGGKKVNHSTHTLLPASKGNLCNS